MSEYQLSIQTKNNGEWVPTIITIQSKQGCLNMMATRIGNVQEVASTMWISHDIHDMTQSVNDVGEDTLEHHFYLNTGDDNERHHRLVVEPYQR